MNILKIAIYIAVFIGATFLFEKLYYMGKLLRYGAPFGIALVFGLVLHYVIGEGWFSVVGPFLMLFIGSCSNQTLFGDGNDRFRLFLIPAALALTAAIFLGQTGIIKLTEKNDPRIREVNGSIEVYYGTFRLEGYQLNYGRGKPFPEEDYPKPYYFSYMDVSENRENSGNNGLTALEIPCLPTEKKLSQIKTLVVALKHRTAGAAYDKYINGVRVGDTTLYNCDLSFLIVNLDTRECFVVENAIFGSDAGYDEHQPKIGRGTAKNYIKAMYRQ